MKEKVTKVLTYVMVALLSCAVTMTVMFMAMDTEPAYSKLSNLKQLIETCFIGDADTKAMEDAAANAMVGAIGDRWSHYMTAEEFSSYLEQMSNSYVGVGITVQLNADGKGIDVIQVTRGGPAEEAGILAGDIIVSVDGTELAGKTVSDASVLIKGDAGTKISVTLLRNDAQFTVEVERRKIETDVAVGTLLPGNIGLIRIVNFDSRCADEAIAAIQDLVGQGAEKLIFDVRYNPGGYASELVKLLNHLLPEGELFRTVDYAGKENVDYSDAACLKMPMAVLVNGDSYSAAEFFAAALREYEWATVVGTQTCGKGYFQNTFRLGDGSAVALSVGKYFTPKGVSLAEVGGLTPDHVVEVTEETDAAIYAGTLDPMEDPQILAAIEALKN